MDLGGFHITFRGSCYDHYTTNVSAPALQWQFFSDYMQRVIFAFVYHWIAPEAHLVSSSRVFPAFFSLVTLGFLYKLLILYDTLSQQNTIQVFGLCLYSITLCIYNATQYQQLEGSALVLADNDVIRGDTWLVVRGIVISIIVITTAFTLWMFLLAWELYDEFAWATFRQVEANLEMRRRFLHFQVPTRSSSPFQCRLTNAISCLYLC